MEEELKVQKRWRVTPEGYEMNPNEVNPYTVKSTEYFDTTIDNQNEIQIDISPYLKEQNSSLNY